MNNGNTMNKFKGVDYAYPGSVSATKCGKARAGCYTVTVYTQAADGSMTSKTLIHGYDTREEACAAAAQRPEPWGGVWKRYMRHAIAKAEGVTPDEIYQRRPQDPAHIL